ncbi:MAG: autotransporter-associated beta strand repeat-containing protein [Planctomycetes bacterium]|nr:autotransporter-associated beta strand repeat-containing protein [Planctomycetota bacterium]
MRDSYQLFGIGTLTLTNASSYGGPTTVNAGTLDVTNGGELSTGGVHVGEGGFVGALNVTSANTLLDAGGFHTVGDNAISGGPAAFDAFALSAAGGAAQESVDGAAARRKCCQSPVAISGTPNLMATTCDVSAALGFVPKLVFEVYETSRMLGGNFCFPPWRACRWLACY